MINKIAELKGQFSIWDKKQNWNKYADLLGSFWLFAISLCLIYWILVKMGVASPLPLPR